MCRASELVDGYEPHDQFYLRDTSLTSDPEYSRCRGRGVPGVAVGGYREGAIPGTNLRPTDPSFEAYLMNYEINSVHTAV